MGYVEDRLKEIEASAGQTGGRRLKNIERCKTRHGKIALYYRVGKGKRIRLPNREDVSNTEFEKAYLAAASGAHVPKPARAQVKGEFAPPGRPGYVYFVRHKDAVKIGFTTSIKQRMKSIQTACADPVDILMVMPATDATEAFLHKMFKDYRIGGEWFSLTGLLAEFLGHGRED